MLCCAVLCCATAGKALAVLSDADARQVHRGRRQHRRVGIRLLRVNVVDLAAWRVQAAEEPLAKVPPEGRAVGVRNAHVCRHAESITDGHWDISVVRGGAAGKGSRGGTVGRQQQEEEER